MTRSTIPTHHTNDPSPFVVCTYFCIFPLHLTQNQAILKTNEDLRVGKLHLFKNNSNGILISCVRRETMLSLFTCLYDIKLTDYFIPNIKLPDGVCTFRKMEPSRRLAAVIRTYAASLINYIDYTTYSLHTAYENRYSGPPYTERAAKGYRRPRYLQRTLCWNCHPGGSKCQVMQLATFPLPFLLWPTQVHLYL
jgi:hypothetical protein